MTDPKIETLDPVFRPIAYMWLNAVRGDLGINVRVLEGLRDRDRQVALQAAGKSQVKVGWHNFGLALDFACLGTNGVYITDGGASEYELCGVEAEKLGGVWGGRWTMKDSGHIEYHPDGKTLAEVIGA